MNSLTSAWEILVISCGLDFLVFISAVELTLIVLGIWFVRIAKHQQSIGIFLPLTAIPLLFGGFRSLLTLTNALTLIMPTNASDPLQPDGALLLGMSAAPLLLGMVSMTPCFLLMTAMRVTLVWRASYPATDSSSIVQPSSSEPERVARSTHTVDDCTVEETDRYIAQLTRYHR